MKKCLLGLLVFCNVSYPVILKNGVDVPYETVTKTMNILNHLYKQNAIYELSFLRCAAHSPELVVVGDQRLIYFRQDINKILNNIKATGICDQSGKLDKDVAEIIKVSVFIGYKGPQPITWNVSNPVSFGDFLNKKCLKKF